MKIWVCGSNGMLGSHFKKLLFERKIPFITTSHSQLDITELDPLSDFVRVQKVTHIVNCAAYTQVDRAESEPKLAYMTNAIGPHNLGIAGRRHRARVIHFSTDYVFDGKAKAPYMEENLCSPLGAYGMSKLAGEMKLLGEHSDSVVIRTSWLYGLSGKNFVQTMLKLMSERESLKVVEDQTGRPTYCQDLAESALTLLNAEGIFHFANAFESTWYGFAKEIYKQAKELGYPLITGSIDPISTADYPTAAARPIYSTLSTKKIESRFGVSPRPWQEALNDYLIQYKPIYESTDAFAKTSD